MHSLLSASALRTVAPLFYSAQINAAALSPLATAPAFVGASSSSFSSRSASCLGNNIIPAMVASLESAHSNRLGNSSYSSSFSTRLMAAAENNIASDRKRPRPSGPPLVDVDCNLLHPDLLSSVVNSSAVLPSQIEEEKEEGMAMIDNALKILHHPSTIQSNIVAMISPSSTIDESERSLQLLQSATEQQRNGICVKTTVGVHPYHALDVGAPQEESLGRLRALLDGHNSRQHICCIGEMGLDYSEGFPEKQYQLSWFKAQLDMALEYSLPVFLHERCAFHDTLQCIDDAEAKGHSEGKPMPKIIVHCFTGSFDECAEYMKRGYYISVSGYINKAGEGADEVKRCLREGIIPMDKLMIETDAPYMGFKQCRESFFEIEGESFTSLPSKKRKNLLKSLYPNVPSSLPMVLAVACEELNTGRRERNETDLSLDELAKITTENAALFFDLDGVV